MQINLENKINHTFDNRKKTLFKYFSKPNANIIKVNSTLNYENFFLIQNENLSESIALLRLNTSNKSSAYADFEIFEIKQINLNQSFPLKNSEKSETETKAFKILGVFNHLDKLYLINSLNSVYIIDLNSEQKVFYKLKTHEDEEDLEENTEICNLSAYAVVKPKIIFSGGITKDGKLNKNLLSFDISTYKFEINKVRENNFIGRYRHGMYSDNLAYLYVLGGFSKLLGEEQIEKINEENSCEFICEKIQLIKFDNLMETYMELQFEGRPPRLMVDPYIQVFKARFLFAFSKFKYEKIWYLDINSNASNEINLNYMAIPKNLNIYNGFFCNDKDKCFIACYPIYSEEAIRNAGKIEIKEKTLQEEFISEDENKFNFVIKYLPIVEQEENVK